LLNFVIRRIFQALVVLILVSFAVFFIMRLLPGDPILIHYSEQRVSSLTENELNALRHEVGLDKPITTQVVLWIWGVVRGDLGKSLQFTSESVSSIIAKRLPISAYLGFLSLIISGFLGIIIGIICAVKRGSWLDMFMTILANTGVAVPVFWLAILMIYLFGLKLGWFSIQGFTFPTQNFWLSIKQTIMPVICLSLFELSSTARQTRSNMLEVIQQDYIRTAWSKGLPENIIIIKHALRNALIPIVTLFATSVPIIVGGEVLVETIFNIPGIGRMMVAAIFKQDYTLIQGGLLVTAVAVVLVNLVVDISYVWLDPRIRYE
jgi:peptide/nickel transport system permease protein